MRWPVQPDDDDPILDHPDALPLFQDGIFSFSGLVGHFDVVCPVDGCIALSTARYVSRVWRYMDGRRIDLDIHICPQCLAIIGRNPLRRR